MNSFKIICAAFVFLAAVCQPYDAGAGVISKTLPQFSSSNQKDWINSKPLEISDLKGKTVLIYFWTFDCWNSYRSFPWLHKIENRFADKGFQAIGIHTPEFEHEKVRENLEAKMKRFKITHPVMMDNGFKYWRKMKNRYWPTFYLIDRSGNIRHKMIGETHIGQKKAEKFERVLEGLVNR